MNASKNSNEGRLTMPSKIETLERALLYQALADEGKYDRLKEIFDEIVEEARTDVRGKRKTKKED